MNDLMNNIKNLREMTGAGFLDCKKALEENDNNLDKSVDFLRKKGLAKANKKSSRATNEGAVGIFSNNDTTSIIQINTETDFSAKNEVFLNFMEMIGNFSLELTNTDILIDDFNQMIFKEISITDHFKSIIAKIGENIVLTDLVIIKNSDTLMTSNYIHNSYRKNIGKIAVVLISDVKNINEDAKLFGKNLCMHIAASKPLAMNIEQLDKDLIKKEKEVQLESIKSSGKPDNIIDKILEGKMKKFYSESTFLNQQYILDTDKTVEKAILDFSEKNKFKVISYDLIFLGS
tara:strand:- start:633 stop:1499 length:867 start_codon:yes stop_codon:yes gene_type:complete